MEALKQVVMAFSPVPTYVEPEIPGPYDGQELGTMWLKWVATLSSESIRHFELVLLVRSSYELPEETQAWGKVTRFPENSYIASWPLGPNLVFQQALWYQYHGRLSGPFLWCEPDCVPLVPQWLDLIVDEYARGRKPFMGNIVETAIANGTRSPRHMTGNAVYPDKAYLHAPKLMDAYHSAWDILAADQIVPKCHQTNLIQHEYRSPEIKDRAELQRILKPEAALYHTDKYGAIQRILGSPTREPIVVPELPEDAPIVEPAELSMPRRINDYSIEEILQHMLNRCADDPNVDRKVTKFMVEQGIVNQGHVSYYNRNKKGPKAPPRPPSKAPPGKSLKIPEVKDENELRSRLKEDAAATVSTR